MTYQPPKVFELSDDFQATLDTSSTGTSFASNNFDLLDFSSGFGTAPVSSTAHQPASTHHGGAAADFDALLNLEPLAGGPSGGNQQPPGGNQQPGGKPFTYYPEQGGAHRLTMTTNAGIGQSAGNVSLGAPGESEELNDFFKQEQLNKGGVGSGGGAITGFGSGGAEEESRVPVPEFLKGAKHPVVCMFHLLFKALWYRPWTINRTTLFRRLSTDSPPPFVMESDENGWTLNGTFFRFRGFAQIYPGVGDSLFRKSKKNAVLFTSTSTSGGGHVEKTKTSDGSGSTPTFVSAGGGVRLVPKIGVVLDTPFEEIISQLSLQLELHPPPYQKAGEQTISVRS